MMEAGVYDDLCTMVCDITSAEGVVLIVFEGDKGNGFSVQARPSLGLKLPGVLERIALELRKERLTE